MKATICIDQEHPALPGHFPGRPIVPGVVLLSEVIAHYQQLVDQPLTLVAVPAIKFKKILLPGQTCTIEYDQRPGNKIAFVCSYEGAEIAAGSLSFQPGDGGTTI